MVVDGYVEGGEEEWEETVHEGGREDEDESLGGSGKAAIKNQNVSSAGKKKGKRKKEETYVAHSTQPASSSPSL